MNAHTPFTSDLRGASADLAALLALLVSPAATKQRLDELVAQENATREQIAALNDMAADTRRMNTAAQAATIVLNNRKTALDAREAEIKQLEATGSEAAMRRREAAAAAKEKAAAVKENAVERREAAVAKREAEIEAKHRSIKGLADTIGR